MYIQSSTAHKLTGRWQEFLQSHPENTIFQSPEMYFFYQKVHYFTPHLFISQNDFGEMTGVLLAVLIREGNGLKGFLSSRVVVYGGPVIARDENRLLILDELLHDLVRQLGKKSVFIQFRNFFTWSRQEKQIFEQHGFIFRDHLNLLVETTDEESTWYGLSQSRRRQIRKALRTGVYLEEPQNEAEMKQLYHLLSRLYKTKVKKPLPSWSFFKAFYHASVKEHLGIIRLVKRKEEIIGGIIAPVTSGKVIYEWYVVGLDKQYKDSFPSVMATWSALDYALKNKLKHFDFMGMGIPARPYGVRDFKMKFGGKMVNYGRFARRNNSLVYRFSELGYNLVRLTGL
jgi:serine/alanine adding enzyme